MLDVRRLRLLRELHHRGTIAAVAEALAFTPSAVSQQLATLEREAGVTLLERTGRRVTLTPAARGLVGHAEAVLERLEQAAAELAAARAVAGPLRVGTFPTAARRIVPAALAALGADHPELVASVWEIDPAQVASALRGGDLDVALVHSYDGVPDPPVDGVATEPLFAEPMYLAAPRGWTSTSTPEPLARWRDVPWIVAPPTTRCGSMTAGACRAAGFTPQVRHVVDDFATAVALVGVGHGVAMVPELGIDGPHPEVTFTPLPMRRHTSAAYRRGAAGHPAIAAFIAAVRAAAGGQESHFPAL
ncbi:LysR family transcriptional regulator [Pseudonocardia sp. TRM90224]|uniref:LysR family transcriptional regulator n=1 Tax=Pseudonocardia sp. TRM90224 TaxID=2812678 RepID=UPI001E53A01D|nr:LysR family transcriptional regulator [Pseudonocardia sp. TRM90224]